MDSPEVDPCIYDQVIFEKGAKAIWCRKNSVLNKTTGTTEYSHPKR